MLGSGVTAVLANFAAAAALAVSQTDLRTNLCLVINTCIHAFCAAVLNRLPWLLLVHQRHNVWRNRFDCIIMQPLCLHKVFPRRSRLLTLFWFSWDEVLHEGQLTTLRSWWRHSRRSSTDARIPALPFNTGSVWLSSSVFTTA